MTAKCHVCHKPEGQEHESWCSVAPDRVQGVRRECGTCRHEKAKDKTTLLTICFPCKRFRPKLKDNWQPQAQGGRP